MRDELVRLNHAVKRICPQARGEYAELARQWRVYEDVELLVLPFGAGVDSVDPRNVKGHSTEALVGVGATWGEALAYYVNWRRDPARVSKLMDRQLRGQSVRGEPPPEPPEFAQMRAKRQALAVLGGQNQSEWIRKAVHFRMLKKFGQLTDKQRGLLGLAKRKAHTL